jgi:flavin reductase (DIM6/NTAB) family NADH-FMN oxidoreductase RutF
MTIPAMRTIRPSILYFGTPVVLLSTVDADGRPNLTPMSSAWALGPHVVLGLADGSQGLRNLLATGEAVLNLPDAALWPAVEAIARTTGRDPVPAYKQAMGYRHEADKFRLAGLTPLRSERVMPPRVAECPLQLELRLLRSRTAAASPQDPEPDWQVVEAEVLRVHGHEQVLVPGRDHVDPLRWGPLLYVFRHYVAAGRRLGRNFRAES